MVTFCVDNPDKVKRRLFQCSKCEQTFIIEASLDLDFDAKKMPKV